MSGEVICVPGFASLVGAEEARCAARSQLGKLCKSPTAVKPAPDRVEGRLRRASSSAPISLAFLIPGCGDDGLLQTYPRISVRTLGFYG
jgi:hypothetical protein